MRLVYLLFCLACSYIPLYASTQEEGTEEELMGKPAEVKVLLKKHIDGALIEVRGAYDVVDPYTGKIVSSGIKGKRFYLYPHKEGLKWGEDFLGIYQIKIIPKKKDAAVLVDGVQYKGNLEIYHVDNLVTVINEVEVEDYLKALLAPKFSKEIQSVVMDSIAIVARTNVYFQIKHHPKAFWHVDGQDVGYHGAAATKFNSTVEHSVDNTKYLVMTYEKDLFATTWNENCAGKTASYQSIFRKNVLSPSGVKSAFAEKGRKEHHWSFTIPKADLAKLAQTNRITNLDLYIDSSSEKVYAMRIQDGTHTKELDFFHLQQGLGKDNLLSNDFTVSMEGNVVTFDGYGEGCSVGLCIYSASQMANRGDNAPEILATFYPMSHIEQMRVVYDYHEKKTVKLKLKKSKSSSPKKEFDPAEKAS